MDKNEVEVKDETKKNVCVYIFDEGGFKSIDKEGSLSYEQLGIKEKLESFISKRLEHFGYKDYFFIKDISEVGNNSCEYSCVLNMVNPFIDPELVSKMVSLLEKCPEYDSCKPEGAIPGTEPEIVFRTSALKNKKMDDLKCLVYDSDTQSKYNNQFNLRKLKRIKMFLKVTELVEDIETLTIPKFIEKLHEDKIFEKLVAYGEDVELISVTECPCCGSELQPLLLSSSQPLIGYLPYNKAIHQRCQKCKLIMLSPYVAADYVEKLYDYHYSESQAKDYFLRKKRRYTHYDTAISMVEKILPENASGIDLGCGAGAFIYHTKDAKPSWNVIGCDLGDRVGFFKGDHEDVEVLHLNFLKDDLGENKYDLVTAWEVIEHVSFADLKVMLSNVYRALKPNGVFLFTTPDFDSPLCQLFDFWGICPPYHPLVFSKSWINYYFSDNNQFKILGIENESAFMEVFESWFGYWENTSKEFQLRAAAKLLLEVLKDEEASKGFNKVVKKNEWGAEMIVALQKK